MHVRVTISSNDFASHSLKNYWYEFFHPITEYSKVNPTHQHEPSTYIMCLSQRSLSQIKASRRSTGTEISTASQDLFADQRQNTFFRSSLVLGRFPKRQAMGAKFFMCLVMIVLVVSPAYCAEWIVRVETGMEDGKRTPLEERLFGSKFRCCL